MKKAAIAFALAATVGGGLYVFSDDIVEDPAHFSLLLAPDSNVPVILERGVRMIHREYEAGTKNCSDLAQGITDAAIENNRGAHMICIQGDSQYDTKCGTHRNNNPAMSCATTISIIEPNP